MASNKQERYAEWARDPPQVMRESKQEGVKGRVCTTLAAGLVGAQPTRQQQLETNGRTSP